MPLTPDYELDLLFPVSLISPDVRRALHKDLHIRPLASTDYGRGHLAVLAVLSNVIDPGEAAWRAQFDAQRAVPDTYYTVVILHRASDTIVGVGSLFVERKFLKGLGMVGHLEDFAVDERLQGRKIGSHLINAVTWISERVGCYRTILNCRESNLRKWRLLLESKTECEHTTAFYEKLGYRKNERQMAKYALTEASFSARL